jgi:hypothetical protein
MPSQQREETREKDSEWAGRGSAKAAPLLNRALHAIEDALLVESSSSCLIVDNIKTLIDLRSDKEYMMDAGKRRSEP